MGSEEHKYFCFLSICTLHKGINYRIRADRKEKLVILSGNTPIEFCVINAEKAGCIRMRRIYQSAIHHE